MPTANPKHRPGKMPAPVYPGCMVAVTEVLQQSSPEVDQPGCSKRAHGQPRGQGIGGDVGLHDTDNQSYEHWAVFRAK